MSRKKVVLVLDECNGPSVYNPVSYTDFLSESDQIDLIIITSPKGLSESDKSKCLDYKEMDEPTTNGLMEVWALKFHEKHKIDMVYTKQEDLILRAAHIRRILGLTNGLLPDLAMIYRDKYLMKCKAQSGGFLVPAFARVYSPIDVLDFAGKHGYPVIVKPTLGQASSGVRVLKDSNDCEAYLQNEFFDRINDRLMDYSGDLIIEKFVPSKMYHVNGYARNGKISIVWPFSYVSTNLDFTAGKAYGNVFIAKNEPVWEPLVNAAQKLLDILTTPEHLIFHAELFEVKQNDGSVGFALCEIAARRPGGSIGLLIDEAEGGVGLFPEIEFRLNLGLNLRHDRESISKMNSPCFGAADLMIPRQLGKLVSLPDSECPLPNMIYKPIAKAGTVYQGFSVNTMNTAARFIASAGQERVSCQTMEARLNAALAWFNRHVVYDRGDSGLEINSSPKILPLDLNRRLTAN